MKKLTTIMFCLFVISGDIQVFGQFPVFEKKWDKRFGGLNDEVFGTFQIMPDSGFAVGGSSFSGISGDKSQANHDTSLATSDFWVVRTDSAGNLLWDQRYGGDRSELLTDLILTADGGLLMTGQSFSDNSGDKSEPNRDTTLQTNDYWMVKTDASGTKQWDKRFGGSSFDIPGRVTQLPDQGFLICGSSYSGIGGDKTEAGRGGWDYWVVRTDPMGAKIWDRRFGGSSDDFATTVVSHPDGKLIIGGYSLSGLNGDKSEPSRGSWDYWVVCIDTLGNKIWDHTYGGSDIDWLFSAVAVQGDGFLLGGQSFSGAGGDKSEDNHDPGPSGSDRWIVRIHSDGVKLWDRTFGGTETDDLKNIVQTADGGFLLSGESYSDSTGNKSEPNLGPEQTWLVKTDSAGNFSWDKTLFTYGHDEKGMALPYSDACFIAVNFTQADTGGYKSQPTQGYGDFWIIKMCESDPLGFETIPGEVFPATVFPNPHTDQFTLQLGEAAIGLRMEIFDALGRMVYHFQPEEPQRRPLTISTTGWEPGFYWCRIGYRTASSRFLKIIKSD